MLWLPRCLCLTISVKDSTEIMEHLDLLTGVTTLPPLSTPKQRLASLLIELLGDEWLLPAAFHWRWAYTGAGCTISLVSPREYLFVHNNSLVPTDSHHAHSHTYTNN